MKRKKIIFIKKLDVNLYEKLYIFLKFKLKNKFISYFLPISFCVKLKSLINNGRIF